MKAHEELLREAVHLAEQNRLLPLTRLDVGVTAAELYSPRPR